MGSDLVMQDVGANASGQQEPNNIPMTTTIPAWVYSNRPPRRVSGGPQTGHDWTKYKPDMLIVNGRRKSCRMRHAHIIELKYCRDTDRAPQTLRAQQQHLELRSALISVGYREQNIYTHVITLGAGGTVYKDFFTTMAQLGVHGQRARMLAHKLHMNAINSAKSIVLTKYVKDKQRMRTTADTG